MGKAAEGSTPATSTSGTVGFNFGKSSEDGSFASVVEQSGINARDGGFDIKVRGATELEAAIISSTAAAELNRLETGTLTSKDLVNVEEFKASSVNLSASLSGIGAKKGAETAPVSSDENGQVDATNSGKGVTLPGLATALGTITAGAPQALGASGAQEGTTTSAIANGTILITSDDAASQETADSISRDTGSANDGALEQEFDDAKRAEIQESFAVTKDLIAQTSIFFANRAREEKAKRDEAANIEKDLVSKGLAGRDFEGKLVSIGESSSEVIEAIENVNSLINEANKIDSKFGAGSPARIISTAINGAAGGNAAGSVGDLIQSTAINAIQSLAVTEVKLIADGLLDGNGNPTAKSETLRTALQAITGCAGASIAGADCKSGAIGAASSVVINNLISEFFDPKTKNESDEQDPRSLEDQQARSNIVASIIAIISQESGLNAAIATTAAQIETENNENSQRNKPSNIARLLNSIPFLSKENDNVLSRSLSYANFDISLNSSGSVYKTNFFAAASDATGLNGLTGAQFFASLPGADIFYDDASLEALQDIGAGLWKDVNVPTYQALYNGNDNYRLLDSSTLGSITNGSIQNLDYALVRNEQVYVQGQLDSLPNTTRQNLIQQSNEILNKGLTYEIDYCWNGLIHLRKIIKS